MHAVICGRCRYYVSLVLVTLFSQIALSDWEPVGLEYAGDIYALTFYQGYLFAGTDIGVFKSSDQGLTWIHSNTGLPAGTSVGTFLAVADTLYIGMDGTVTQYGVYKTTDLGVTWVRLSAGLPGPVAIYSLLVVDDILFAGTSTRGVYKSFDFGNSWSDAGLSPSSISSLGYQAPFLFADRYRSSNLGLNWEYMTSGLPAASYSVHSYLALGNRMLMGLTTGLFASQNFGGSWGSSLGDFQANDLFFAEDVLMAVGFRPGPGTGWVFVTTNGGTTWIQWGDGLPGWPANVVHCGTVDSMYVYVGTSVNGGVWRRPRSELQAALPVQLAMFTGSRMGNGEVLLQWRTIAEINNFGFEVQGRSAAATDFTTIENSFIPGHGSTLVPQDYRYVDSRAVAGRVYYRLRQIDLDGTIHYSDAIHVDVPTGVQKTQMPLRFRLYQNYPNPFNPTTTIRYDLPEQTHVRLALFDMLGREVRVLVEEFQDAGEKWVTLDATGLASGVYVCRLTSMDKSATIVVDLLR